MSSRTLDDVGVALAAANARLENQLRDIAILPVFVGEEDQRTQVAHMAIVQHPCWGVSLEIRLAIMALHACSSVEDLYRLLNEPGGGIPWVTDEGKKTAPGTAYFR